jgi:hypothetical protein
VLECNIKVFYFLINVLRFFQHAVCIDEFTKSFLKAFIAFLYN